MGDILLSTGRSECGELGATLRDVFRGGVSPIWEYSGPWGALAVRGGHYKGFDPVETSTHICVVVGGPVLRFVGHGFLVDGNCDSGTRAVLERILSEGMSWEQDLDGPFVVLVVEKVSGKITCMTDLMMFIPVYEYRQDGQLALGTHVDAVASVSGKASAFDEASLVDFILHDVVTYPYTAYQGIWQLTPAAEHSYIVSNEGGTHKLEPNVYWEPVERYAFGSIDDAADALRFGLEEYVARATAGMDHIAQFISGGEDSRALAGLLPTELKRDAYIFLDNMNREGQVADRVAKAYGATFYPVYRSPTHYVEILEEASRLVGVGHQYTHAHALGFHSECKLDQYQAVFGGYLSDSLLKGAYARKPRGYERFPFLPEVSLSGESRCRPLDSPVFRLDLLREVEQRRCSHLERVRTIRPRTAHEWFVLWPMTMRTTIPNLYSTRRLFASYEPFMSNSVVKVCASVPLRWKLNRRLFLRSARPWLQPARSVQHGDGRFPHLSWVTNTPLQASVWAWRQVQRKIMRKRFNEGPWGDWQTVVRSRIWQEKWFRLAAGSELFERLFEGGGEQDKHELLERLPIQQQVNLLQIAGSVGFVEKE